MKNKNVVLITVDALRADRLGFMGNQRNVSLNIVMLAESGIYFTNTMANAPYTTASIKSMLT